MQSSRELLTTAYERFNARDIEAVLALMHPDVNWANGMTGGRVLGRDNVREYWRGQWTILDPRVEPVGFKEDESGRIRVSVHQVVRDLAGKILVDQMVEHVYLIQNGLIDRMDIAEPGAVSKL
jgi:hypothetical protein